MPTGVEAGTFLKVVTQNFIISKLFSIFSYVDLQSTEMFKNSGGPKMLVGILNDGTEDVNVLNSGFSVVAAAATGNEVLKELFMDLKIEEIIAIILRKCGKLAIPSLYDAIRVLLTADDNRVVASQVSEQFIECTFYTILTFP